MDGVRTTLLPPNRKLVDRYFAVVWQIVHTLSTAALSLDSVLPDSGKFKLYLEAEETRLETNLRAVNYVIDGIDTLTLITGGGRIEKVGILQRTLRRSGLIPVFKFRPSFRCYTC